MFRPRVIPVLLLRNQGLVKSIRFKDFRYIGDPINAVKIFNDLRADELVFLDITASKEIRKISLDFVRKVGDECNMPFAVGGGIGTIEDIREILNSGAEKVVINTAAAEKPDFIRRASEEFGSSTIVVCIDIKKKFLGGDVVWIYSGSKATTFEPVTYARFMADNGAGELFIQSIDFDGMMEGYNLELISRISNAVTIPVIACSGAGSNHHLSQVVKQSNASAVAAGSLFVYHGPRRAVLINYPTQEELRKLFHEDSD
jgi:imidazole glycerol-phosphate synthase subunit HisF